jgi:hypothetical protein
VHGFSYIRKPKSFESGNPEATFYELSNFPLFGDIYLLDIWKDRCEKLSRS